VVITPEIVWLALSPNFERAVVARREGVSQTPRHGVFAKVNTICLRRSPARGPQSAERPNSVSKHPNRVGEDSHSASRGTRRSETSLRNVTRTADSSRSGVIHTTPDRSRPTTPMSVLRGEATQRHHPVSPCSTWTSPLAPSAESTDRVRGGSTRTTSECESESKWASTETGPTRALICRSSRTHDSRRRISSSDVGSGDSLRRRTGSGGHRTRSSIEVGARESLVNPVARRVCGR